MPVRIANYGKEMLRGKVFCELSGEGFCRRVELPETAVPAGELTDAGQTAFSLEGLTNPVRLNLELSLGDIKNSYPVWVYPLVKPVFEFRCGGGSVLFSSMGLQELQQYPEARALLAAIYHYMDSGEFLPEQELSEEELETMVRVKKA